MLSGEGGNFVTVATNGHGAPAAAAGARIVVEVEATLRIGAETKARSGALGDNLGPGPGHGSEQPVQATFAGHEFDFPGAVSAHEFIMPFGDAQDFVYGLNRFPGDPLLAEHGREYFAQGGPKPAGLQEKRFGSLEVDLRQTEKLRAALGGNDFGRLEKADQAFPGEFSVGRAGVDKINGEPPAQQRQMLRGEGHDEGKPSKKRNTKTLVANNQLTLP